MAYSIIPYPAMPTAYTRPSRPRTINMLVLHATVGSKAGDLRTLTGRDPNHVVSTHYYITKLGEIYHMVDDRYIAWHAGVSYWQGDSNCNQFSLGVELENWNDGVDKYTEPQMAALLWLCRTKVEQYAIPAKRFVRHSDIAPGRKSDPRGFPWRSFKTEVYNAAPDEPPDPSPPPSPDVRLRDALLNWSYEQVGHVYHPDWTLHQFAIKQRLGPPLGPPFSFRAERHTWVGENYGRDAICSPTSDWQLVYRLSELNDGPLKGALRDTAYHQLGVRYRPDWAQHQYADHMLIGLPLSENVRLTLPDGRSFGTQIWSLDSLYSLDGQWDRVSTLNELLNEASDGAAQRLRDALLNQSYQRVGTRYHPDWSTHQFALLNRLGAPITNQALVQIDTQELIVVAFARSIIFSPYGDWTVVHNLNDLLDDA